MYRFAALPLALGLILGACGGDDDEGTGGGGGGGPDVATATITISGAQSESWTFNETDNDFTCVAGNGSLNVLIRRQNTNNQDSVQLKMEGGTYEGPGTYSWMAESGQFDQQVLVAVGSSFEYETDVIGGAVATCTVEIDEVGTRLEGQVDCTEVPSSNTSADTPDDASEPRPTIDVSMTFDCATL